MEEIDVGSLASDTIVREFPKLLTKVMPSILVGYQFAGYLYAWMAEAMKSVKNTAAKGERYKGTWSTQRHIT